MFRVDLLPTVFEHLLYSSTVLLYEKTLYGMFGNIACGLFKLSIYNDNKL